MTVPIEFVFYGYCMNGHFFVRAFELADRFHEIHQVAQLVKQAHVWIRDDDPFGTSQIGAKQGVKTHASLIFLKDQMLLL